ncbi:helix-turn-helix domain-containing protein [Lactobacillus delbrueckii]|uniref:helix-turn-helix domain-containing protein n=1 Tax=Lactobacillus delbrueckii TaxID=1584 RepID=UPI0007394E74|nr:helix-turn-helix transcriptional regulator [Lactobacillus delbrueckii]CUS17287.1 Predicted transcriptional regulator [Lactobacillus delbrueckii subsp. bulgaricus]
MAFSYRKLWVVAAKHGLNKTQLRDQAGISNGCLAKLSKNHPVSMETMGKICESLDCNIGDIVDYVKGDE